MHLDLKPENIFLKQSKQVEVKLVNLGCSKRNKKDAETMPYMSPQMFKTDPASGKLLADQRSDVWSLGVILYRMMTFNLPFNDEASIKDMKKTIPFEEVYI